MARTSKQISVDTNTPIPSSKTVYVFCNLPHGQSFGPFGKGKVVEIKGVPVSKLRNYDGSYIPGGEYAWTTVDASDWAEVKRIYGKMEIFISELVFDAPTLEVGIAMAKERSALRYGTEPLEKSDLKRTEPKPNAGA